MNMTRNPLFLAIAGSAVLTISSAQAQSSSWLGDAAGDWGDSTKWTGSIIADGADNTATFGNVITLARIINLETARTIGNITASDTGQDYTISGANILTLDRTDATKPTLSVTQSGRILTISSVVTGSDGLQKTGAGQLTLSGINTFTGGTTLAAGTLATTADANFGGAGSGITVTGNSTWNAGAAVSVTYNRDLAINAGTLTVTSGNAVKTITGVFSGSGAINNTSTTGFTFSNTGNTFTGTVNSGYQMTFASLGDSSNPINLVGSNSDFIWSGGAKTFALRPFTIQASSAAPSIFANGTGPLVIQQALAITGAAGARTLTLDGTSTGANEFSGVIADGAGSVVTLAKAGGGTWIVSGNNTHTGGLSTGNGGTTSLLGLGSATAWGTGTFTIGTGRFDNTSGSALTMSGNNAIAWNGDTTFVGTNALDLGTGALTMGGNRTITVGGSLTMGGVVSDGASDFNIVKGGGGTFVLSGLNSYSGRTTVNQGIVSINTIGNVGAGNSSLGNPTTVVNGTINLGSTTLGGTLLYTGTTTSTDRVINLSGTTGGAALNMSGSGTLTFTSNFTATGSGVKTLTLTGSTAGTGVIEGAIVDNSVTNTTKLAKTGSGTWTLSGPNTYSGGTTIGNNTQNVGTLNITHGSALGTGAVSIVSNFGSGNFATLTLNSASGITVANNFTTSGDGQGNNGIIRNVTGNNEISGTITLGGGGGSTRIGSDGGSLTLSNTIAPNTTLRNLTLSGSSTGTVSGAINDGAGANTLAALIKQGTGTWTLSGANTYTGATTVSGGTLLINGTHTGGGLITVSSAATLGGSTGTGQIGNVDMSAGGTLRPGDAERTDNWMKVADLTLAAATQLYFELDAPDNGGLSLPANDLVLAANPVLAGVINVTPLAGFSVAPVGSKWRLVSLTSGTVPATHSLSLETALATSYNIEAVEGSDSVYLVAVPEVGTAGLLALGLLLLRRLRRH